MKIIFRKQQADDKIFIYSFLLLFPVVLFACIFFTVSSAFEFQLVSDEYKNHELCKNTSNRSQVAENTTMTMSATMTAAEMSPANDYESSLNLLEFDYSSYNFNEDDSRLKRSLDNDVFSDGISSTNDTEDYSELSYKTSYNPADVDHYVNDAERDNAPSQVIPKRNHDTCSVSDFYCHLERIVGEDEKDVTGSNKTLRSLRLFCDS